MPKAKATFLLLFLIGILLLVVNTVYGLIFMPMPHDEALYKMLCRSIQRVGWPLRPSGELFTVNPPLAFYFQAAAEKIFGSGVQGIRVWHQLLYVIPTILLTMHMSRRLFGVGAACAVPLLFGSVAYFFFESIPAEIDMPFMFVYVLLLDLMMLREEWRRAGNELLTLELAIGGLVAVLMLLKFFQALVILPTLLTALLFEARGNVKPLMTSLARIGAIALLGPVIWISWAAIQGTDLFLTLNFLSGAVFKGEARYATEVTTFNFLKYWTFLASHISLPLFIAVIFSVFIHATKLKELRLPLVWIAWVLIAIAVSSIRVVRYFDPVLPVAILLASGMLSDRVIRLIGASAKRYIYIGITLLLILYLAEVFMTNSLSLAGFNVELYKLIFLAAMFVLAIGACLAKWRPHALAIVFPLLIGGSLLFSYKNFPINRFDRSTLEKNISEESVGRRLASQLTKNTTLVTTSMRVAYYADRDYYHLQNKTGLKAIEAIRAGSYDFLVLQRGELDSFKHAKQLRQFVQDDYAIQQELESGYTLYERKPAS